MFYGKVIESSKGSLSLDKAQQFIASEKCGASLFFIGTVRNHNNNKKYKICWVMAMLSTTLI